jgi:capsid portal protein
MIDFRPLETTREDRAMEYHEKVQKQWEATGRRLAEIVGRDPSTLSMFSDDTTRTISEERTIIDQVLNAMRTKDMGRWSTNPRIGDLYAQPEKPRLTNFETIRNPDSVTNAPGERPTDFLRSKYFRKRVKELRSYIEKIRPFNVESDGQIGRAHV